MVVWQRIIMSDGSSVVIEILPVTDGAGYAGLEDEVVRSSLQVRRLRRWR